MKLFTKIISIAILTLTACSSQIKESNIIGTWDWKNANKDYPVHFEFRDNGELKITNFRPDKIDVDDYIWDLVESSIYYSREGVGETSIFKMGIIESDDAKLLLKIDDGSEVWLTRIK